MPGLESPYPAQAGVVIAPGNAALGVEDDAGVTSTVEMTAKSIPLEFQVSVG